MLDAFLNVLVKKASDKKTEDELTAHLTRLPLNEIQKIARLGSVKKAFCGDGDDGKWLARYEDTALYEKALALEEELLKIEAQRIERRLKPEPEIDNLYAQEDMVRLKKRQLDLELSKLRAGGEAEPAANDLEEENDMEEEEEPAAEDGSMKSAHLAFVRKLAACSDPTQGLKAPAVKRPPVPSMAVKTASVLRPFLPAFPGLPKEACFDLAGRALAHAEAQQASLRAKHAGIGGAIKGALREGAIQGGTGAAGGALGGALFGGVGALPGAAIGGAGGAINGIISGAAKGFNDN